MRKTTLLKMIIAILTVMTIVGCKQSEPKSRITTGNQINFGVQGIPASLNMYIDYNTFSITVCSMMYESLLERDPTTLEIRGKLANKWSVDNDNLLYTFYLDPNAKWADGSPVTSADVVFTFDTIMNPANLTSLFRAGYEDCFEYVRAIDERTVVFKARNKRWLNFDEAMSLTVLPKYLFDGKDFNKDFNITLPPGSGPYEIKEIVTDRYITMKKRHDYWDKARADEQHLYNFEEIKYKVINEAEIMFEALKKGDIDYMGGGSAAQWYTRTEKSPSPQVKNNWIVAKQVYNYHPTSKQFFHLNLRRPIFQDIRIRKALNMLLNFDLIREKIMYNQYDRITSFFPGKFNGEPPAVDLSYNPEAARELLAEAGWINVDNEGILIKDGKRFEIVFTYTDQTLEKHLTIYKEDCKRVGIELKLDLIAQSAFRKKCFEDRDYDIVWIAWGSPLFPGIEDGWRSKFADEPNSNNISGYKNADLDKLLDQYLVEFDEAKRLDLMRQIDIVLQKDVPVVMLWTAPYTNFFYWNRFNPTETYFSKYGDGSSVYARWSHDTDKEAALLNAIETGVSLPATPIQYWYEGLK